MKNNIGVWLDTEKAYIIKLDQKSTQVEKIESEVETRVRYKGETKAYSRMGNQFVNPAKRMTHRRRHQFKQYFDNIKNLLTDAEEIYLFGPAETKLHLAKHLSKDHQLKDKIVGTDTTDLLTENQMIARVKKIFDTQNVRIRN